MISFQLQSLMLSILLFKTIRGSSLGTCSLTDPLCLSSRENAFYAPILNTFNVSADPFSLASAVSQLENDFNYTLSNLTLTGMSKCIVAQVSADTSALTFQLNALCGRLELNANFEFKGNISTYEIEGSGEFKVIQENYLIILSGTYVTFVVDDETYINKTKMYVNINPIGKTKFVLSKLNSGDSNNFTLANEYLNENCLIGEKIFRKPFVSVLAEFFVNYNIAVAAVPLTVLFPAKGSNCISLCRYIS